MSINNSYQVGKQVLNIDDDKEELLIIERYKNEIKLDRFTKHQVKDKINKFMSIYANSNRTFIKLKEFLYELDK